MADRAREMPCGLIPKPRPPDKEVHPLSTHGGAWTQDVELGAAKSNPI